MITRVHISLSVNDLGKTKQFYQALFGQTVSKKKSDYLNFRLDQPPIHLALHQRNQPITLQSDGKRINHFGIELPNHDLFIQWRQRVTESSIALRDQPNASCCYATGDKFWVTDPDQHVWEIWVKTGDLAQNHCSAG